MNANTSTDAAKPARRRAARSATSLAGATALMAAAQSVVLSGGAGEGFDI